MQRQARDRRTGNRQTTERRWRGGFTLAELLVAMVITALASAVIVRSMTFALQFYQARAEDTSAQLLCETVSLLVMDDLTKNELNADKLHGYLSSTGTGYSTVGVSGMDNGYGQPEISGFSLPSACYGYGDKSANSRLVGIEVEDEDGRYKVTVRVALNDPNKADKDKTVLARNEFIVTPVG